MLLHISFEINFVLIQGISSTTHASPDSFYNSNDQQQQQQVTPERYHRTSPVRYPSLPPVPEASEETSTIADRESISSGHTTIDRNHLGQDEKWALQPSLPTINSGEPLTWEYTSFSDNHDPFSDAAPRPRLVQNAYTSDAQHISVYAPYDHPPSQTSHESSNHTYQNSDWDSVNGSGIDHFNHDTEAYASGLSSRPSYRPPRSRSPTPAVDDEDYRVVGNDSVHYTGYSPSPSRQSRASNYDQVPLEAQIGQDMADQTEYIYDDDDGPDEDDSDDEYDEDEDGYPYENAEKLPQAFPPPPAYLPPPLAPITTRHFGPAPVGRVLRRHKTKKRVQLTNGNLVVDLDVPPKLILPRKGIPEMMKTRYTAVTCDPDDFEKNGFFLRQNEMGRTTELMIVITMYNVSHTFCIFITK